MTTTGAIAAALRYFTTPLLPEDLLGSLTERINPLWSTAETYARVETRRYETADTATLTLRPSRGWRPHRPGQWIKVGLDINGVRRWRSFSLSSPPGTDRLITITVKATPGGTVTPHLVHRIRPGAFLRISQPDGLFTLPSPPPPRLLFLTAGSGITPVMAMLRHLAATGSTPDVVMIHSAATAQEVIFGPELRQADERHPTFRLYEHHTRTNGRLDLADLPYLCPDWDVRSTYACGPPGFLSAVATHWQHHGDGALLHQEHFQPPAAPQGHAEGGQIRFVRTGRTTTADGHTSLLQAGEDAGVLMPSGCRAGICHTCLVPLRSGRLRDLRDGRLHDSDGQPVQTCINAPAGPVELDC